MSLIGLGFWISLGLAVLEILGITSIGWWWVATPFLLGLGLTGLIFVVGFLFMLIVAAISNW